MNYRIAPAAAFALALGILCFAAAAAADGSFDAGKAISVISREDGSGTRGAFIELFKIESKTSGGGRKDLTTREAIIANKTDVMMVNIANDPYAIGYISLGSLNASVKPLSVDGVTASAENVKNGSYKISRPFIIATRGEPSGAAGDFIAFILSRDGQAVVAKSYIPVNEQAAPYAGGGKTGGKITVAGSSSVTPIMEKLKEAYIAKNPGAVIEIQMSDSTAGMTGAISGACDIGMSSRALKDGEKAKLTDVAIAHDGIVVVVNNKNPLTNLGGEQVKEIFTGGAASWKQVMP
ncbi:MAG: substrate-binding domain-containing protein [Desulfovibrio sp.]|jgi:phosphate transport system substrate-binding protein|nr:substrate-binding domain-containing protein [Desulfovibrio sp.]